VGLHADPGRARKRRPSRGPFDDSPHLESGGLPPVPQRPTSWQTFLKAYWGAIAAADFFRTEVWTWRGLVTFYNVFVIDLASRRVQILGSTPHPEVVFVQQVVRTLTMGEAGEEPALDVLICDRDRTWSDEVRRQLRDAGTRVVLTPARAPNANASAERFVRSIKEECLDRLIPIGERHFRPRSGGVRRALPSRTEPPGTRQSPDLGLADHPDDQSCATSVAPWRIPQLLPASRVIRQVRPRIGTYGILNARHDATVHTE
jgi:transposase InsO family protein